jgi:hypothetical protein
MPALKRLELVSSGQQTWFLETVQDVMSQLPSLKEIHVDDEWYENFTSRPDQDFRAGVLAFEDFCRNKDITFTLSVAIRTPKDDYGASINLRGLSYSLRLWSSFIVKIRFEAQRSVNSYDDSHTPLNLPNLQEVAFQLPEDPGYFGDLAPWLRLLRSSKLTSLSASIHDEPHATYFAVAIFAAVPTFKALSRLELALPIGFDQHVHDLKETCASQGVDFALRFQ